MIHHLFKPRKNLTAYELAQVMMENGNSDIYVSQYTQENIFPKEFLRHFQNFDFGSPDDGYCKICNKKRIS